MDDARHWLSLALAFVAGFAVSAILDDYRHSLSRQILCSDGKHMWEGKFEHLRNPDGTIKAALGSVCSDSGLLLR
jgi:hypothetical protein